MPKTFPSRTAAATLAVALSLLASLAGLLTPSASSAAFQPNIIWSQQQLNVEVPRGGTVTRQLTFTCDQNLRGLSVRPVSALAGLVSAQPASFGAIGASQPQAITLTFSAALDAPLGATVGAVHMHSGRRTIPQALPVSLNVVEANGQSLPDPLPLASDGTVTVSGVSETTFNSRFSTVRFDVAGATLSTTFPPKVLLNGFEYPSQALQLTQTSVTLSPALTGGRNDIELVAYDAHGRLLSKAVTVWAGSLTLKVSVLDEAGLPSTGALVNVRLGDDRNVKAAGTSMNGSVSFANLPARTVLVEASASGNRYGSAAAANGAQGVVQVRLKGFNVPSPVDNDDFSLGTAGWETGSAPVDIIPHEEGDFVPLETLSPVPSTSVRGAQKASASKTNASRVRLHTQLKAAASAKGHDSAASAADVIETDNDLMLTTSGQGPQTISRTFAAEPGTQEVKVRYKFITTEVPGGYYGTQYNDYFDLTARTQTGGGAATESYTMNDLGLSSFNAAGATDWREFSLPVGEGGDVVQLDVTVANVSDELLDSAIVIDIVLKPKVRLGDIDAVIKDDTATVEVKMSATGAPVTLTLEPKSGTTGAAQFTSTGSATMTVTQTASVEIKGVAESSKKNNIRLKAKDSDGKELDHEDFSVIWVTIIVNPSGTVSADNSRKGQIESAVGSLSLGRQYYPGPSMHSWGVGMEYQGTVVPADFGEEIKLVRWRIESRYYLGDGTTLDPNSGGGPQPDTVETFVDDKPSSQGHVYDYDAPGVQTFFGEPLGNVRRQRANFREWAEYKGRRASDEVKVFVRLSVEKTEGQDALKFDVSGDNTWGLGLTPLTWNLQP